MRCTCVSTTTPSGVPNATPSTAFGTAFFADRCCLCEGVAAAVEPFFGAAAFAVLSVLFFAAFLADFSGAFLAAIARALVVAFGRGLSCGFGGSAFFGGLFGFAFQRRVARSLVDGFDGDHALVVLDAHHLDALRVATRLADAFDGRANGLPAIGDDHHLVLGLDHGDADDRTVAIAGINQDDALAAAVLNAKLLDGRALAVAAFTHREHELAFCVGARKANDRVALVQLDGFDACGGAPSGAYLLFIEANADAVLGGNEELRGAVGDDRREQLV